MTNALTELLPISDADRVKLSRLFKPLNDNVIVAMDGSEKATPGGILLPDSGDAGQDTQSGTVVAHGPGAPSPVTGDRVELSVQVGDRVLFRQYAGGDLKYGDMQLKTMREPDLIAIVNDDDALQPEGLSVRKGGTKKKVTKKKAAKKTKKKAKAKGAKA